MWHVKGAASRHLLDPGPHSRQIEQVIRLWRPILIAAAIAAGLPAALPGEATARGRTVFDDPAELLGAKDRLAIRRAVADEVSSGEVVVAAVRSRGGRSLQSIAAERIDRAPRRTPGIVLLVTGERIATLALAVPKAARGVMKDQTQRITRAASAAYRSGGPAAAVRAALRGLDNASSAEDERPEDAGWVGWLAYLLPVLLFFAVRGAFRVLSSRRRHAAIDASGPVAIKGIAPGVAVVGGKAYPEGALTAPLSGAPCLYWHVEMEQLHIDKTREKYWSREGEVIVDGGGNVIHDRTRPVEREVKVSTERMQREYATERVPFVLYDGDGGELRVLPDAASIVGVATPSRRLKRGQPGYDMLGGPDLAGATKFRTYSEIIVPAQVDVTVTGMVEHDESGRPLVRQSRKGGPAFGISTNTPQEVYDAIGDDDGGMVQLVLSLTATVAIFVIYLVS